MRHRISQSVAVLLVLATLAAGATAQTKKSRKKRATRTTSQTTVMKKAPTTEAGSSTTPTPPTVSKTQTPDEGQLPPDNVRRITPAEALAAVEKGRAVIVDVRGEDSYKAGHIKGALSIPVSDIGVRAGELPRDKMIITYCS